MSLTIRSGGLLVKDPNSTELFTVDWGTERLETGVTIASSSWVIAGNDSILTKSNESITGSSRTTQVLLAAGTLGYSYTVTNRITTNESPAQVMDASFRVLVQDV